jgi:hypothetical protein
MRSTMYLGISLTKGVASLPTRVARHRVTGSMLTYGHHKRQSTVMLRQRNRRDRNGSDLCDSLRWFGWLNVNYSCPSGHVATRQSSIHLYGARSSKWPLCNRIDHGDRHTCNCGRRWNGQWNARNTGNWSRSRRHTFERWHRWCSTQNPAGCGRRQYRHSHADDGCGGVPRLEGYCQRGLRQDSLHRLDYRGVQRSSSNNRFCGRNSRRSRVSTPCDGGLCGVEHGC